MALPKGVQAQETGHDSMLDRVKAARQLVNALAELPSDSITGQSAKFVDDMYMLFTDYEDEELAESEKVTAKRYFWLKDLYDKYCL